MVRMVKLNGINIHYRVEGPAGGMPVVFVNSLGTDFRVFDALVPLLPAGLRFIRYDKRGHGLTDATPAPYRMDQHIADLAALLDELGVSRAAIVGLSIGGMIATGLATKRPDLVRAIVLMDTASKIATTEIWNDRIAAVEKGGIEAVADAVMVRWFSPDFRATRQAELAGWRNMLTRTTADGYAGSSAAIRDTDLKEEMRALRLPVLGIGGRHDLSTPPDLVKSTVALIPGARFVLIDEAGHLPCVEAPGKVAGAINAFFTENGIG